jgi:hypothetical protein
MYASGLTVKGSQGFRSIRGSHGICSGSMYYEVYWHPQPAIQNLPLPIQEQPVNKLFDKSVLTKPPLHFNPDTQHTNPPNDKSIKPTNIKQNTQSHTNTTHSNPHQPLSHIIPSLDSLAYPTFNTTLPKETFVQGDLTPGMPRLAKLHDAPVLPTQSQHLRLGFSTTTLDTQTPVGFSDLSYAYRDLNGTKVCNSIVENYGNSFKPGDVIGCFLYFPPDTSTVDMTTLVHLPPIPRTGCIDNDLQTQIYDHQYKLTQVGARMNSFIEFFKNGISQGIAFTEIPVETFFPTISLYNYATTTVNFGPDFAFPPQKYSSDIFVKVPQTQPNHLTPASIYLKILDIDAHYRILFTPYTDELALYEKKIVNNPAGPKKNIDTLQTKKEYSGRGFGRKLVDKKSTENAPEQSQLNEAPIEQDSNSNKRRYIPKDNPIRRKGPVLNENKGKRIFVKQNFLKKFVDTSQLATLFSIRKRLRLSTLFRDSNAIGANSRSNGPVIHPDHALLHKMQNLVPKVFSRANLYSNFFAFPAFTTTAFSLSYADYYHCEVQSLYAVIFSRLKALFRMKLGKDVKFPPNFEDFLTASQQQQHLVKFVKRKRLNFFPHLVANFRTNEYYDPLILPISENGHFLQNIMEYLRDPNVLFHLNQRYFDIPEKIKSFEKYLFWDKIKKISKIWSQNFKGKLIQKKKNLFFGNFSGFVQKYGKKYGKRCCIRGKRGHTMGGNAMLLKKTGLNTTKKPKTIKIHAEKKGKNVKNVKNAKNAKNAKKLLKSVDRKNPTTTKATKTTKKVSDTPKKIIVPKKGRVTEKKTVTKKTTKKNDAKRDEKSVQKNQISSKKTTTKSSTRIQIPRIRFQSLFTNIKYSQLKTEINKLLSQKPIKAEKNREKKTTKKPPKKTLGKNSPQKITQKIKNPLDTFTSDLSLFLSDFNEQYRIITEPHGTEHVNVLHQFFTARAGYIMSTNVEEILCQEKESALVAVKDAILFYHQENSQFGRNNMVKLHKEGKLEIPPQNNSNDGTNPPTPINHVPEVESSKPATRSRRIQENLADKNTKQPSKTAQKVAAKNTKNNKNSQNLSNSQQMEEKTQCLGYIDPKTGHYTRSAKDISVMTLIANRSQTWSNLYEKQLGNFRKKLAKFKQVMASLNFWEKKSAEEKRIFEAENEREKNLFNRAAAALNNEEAYYNTPYLTPGEVEELEKVKAAQVAGKGGKNNDKNIKSAKNQREKIGKNSDKNSKNSAKNVDQNDKIEPKKGGRELSLFRTYPDETNGEQVVYKYINRTREEALIPLKQKKEIPPKKKRKKSGKKSGKKTEFRLLELKFRKMIKNMIFLDKYGKRPMDQWDIERLEAVKSGPIEISKNNSNRIISQNPNQNMIDNYSNPIETSQLILASQPVQVSQNTTKITEKNNQISKNPKKSHKNAKTTPHIRDHSPTPTPPLEQPIEPLCDLSYGQHMASWPKIENESQQLFLTNLNDIKLSFQTQLDEIVTRQEQLEAISKLQQEQFEAYQRHISGKNDEQNEQNERNNPNVLHQNLIKLSQCQNLFSKHLHHSDLHNTLKDHLINQFILHQIKLINFSDENLKTSKKHSQNLLKFSDKISTTKLQLFRLRDKLPLETCRNLHSESQTTSQSSNNPSYDYSYPWAIQTLPSYPSYQARSSGRFTKMKPTADKLANKYEKLLEMQIFKQKNDLDGAEIGKEAYINVVRKFFHKFREKKWRRFKRKMIQWKKRANKRNSMNTMDGVDRVGNVKKGRKINKNKIVFTKFQTKLPKKYKKTPKKLNKSAPIPTPSKLLSDLSALIPATQSSINSYFDSLFKNNEFLHNFELFCENEAQNYVLHAFSISSSQQKEVLTQLLSHQADMYIKTIEDVSGAHGGGDVRADISGELDRIARFKQINLFERKNDDKNDDKKDENNNNYPNFGPIFSGHNIDNNSVNINNPTGYMSINDQFELFSQQREILQQKSDNFIHEQNNQVEKLRKKHFEELSLLKEKIKNFEEKSMKNNDEKINQKVEKLKKFFQDEKKRTQLVHFDQRFDTIQDDLVRIEELNAKMLEYIQKQNQQHYQGK